MKYSKVIVRLIAFAILWICFQSAKLHYTAKNAQSANDTTITVPLGGNAWRNGGDTTDGDISNQGIVNWISKGTSFTVYIRFAHTGKFKLWLNAGTDAKSNVLVSVLKTSSIVAISKQQPKDYYISEFDVKDTGYVAIQIKASGKTGKIYGNIGSLKLSGPATVGAAYVKNNDGDFFYWGRRGPSVHLSYMTPDNIKAEWFYHEVTVPVDNDVLGSYFMACGFNEGYFGMQVNSPTERHILFSVWSPYKTDNPGNIPADQKIIMLKKGPGVHTGEFGNEGSGGQSYRLYNWKAGNTYRFLMHAKPTDSGYTTYTAYFFAPEVGKWQLIASFNRPHTQTYLNHLHSFLENFDPEQGTITRKVLFNNEWIADENGKWTELNKAKFTIDNTGIQGYRMDYSGGTDGGSFFLKNCGFFNHYIVRNTVFERPKGNKAPDVDLSKLP